MLKYLETIDTANYGKLKSGDIVLSGVGRHVNDVGYMLIVEWLEPPRATCTWLVYTNGQRALANSGLFDTTLVSGAYTDRYFSKAIRLRDSFIAATPAGIVQVDLVRTLAGAVGNSKHTWLTRHALSQ